MQEEWSLVCLAVNEYNYSHGINASADAHAADEYAAGHRKFADTTQTNPAKMNTKSSRIGASSIEDLNDTDYRRYGSDDDINDITDKAWR